MSGASRHGAPAPSPAPDARRASTHCPGTEVEAELVRAVLDDLPLDPAPARVLDLGGGTGLLAEALLRLLPAAASLVLVDDSPDDLAIAARRGAGTPPGRLVLDPSALAELPFAAGAFDLALGALPWPRLVVDRASFAAVRGVLAPGGGVRFATLAAGSFSEVFEMLDELAAAHAPRRATPRWAATELPTAEEVAAALRAAGFVDICVRGEAAQLDYRSVAALGVDPVLTTFMGRTLDAAGVDGRATLGLAVERIRRYVGGEPLRVTLELVVATATSPR